MTWLKESSRRSASRYLAGSTKELNVSRRRSMLILMLIVLGLLAIVFVSGCSGGRTVFVPEESPMRVGPSSSIRVYHRINGEWTLSNNRISIPEGWYLVPPSYVRQ